MWDFHFLTPKDGIALGVPQSCFEQCDAAFLESKSLLSREELCVAEGPLISRFNSCNSCIKTESKNDSAYADVYENYIEPSFGDTIQQCIGVGATVTLSLESLEPVITQPLIGTIQPEVPTGTGTGTGELTGTAKASFVITQTAPFILPTNSAIPTASATGTGSSIDTSWLTTSSATETNTYTLLTGKTITVTELVIATVTRADWTGWSSGDRPARFTGEGETITSLPTGVVTSTDSNGAAAVSKGFGTITTAPISPTGARGSGPKSVAGWVWAVMAVAIAIVIGTLVASFVLLKRKRAKKARHQRSDSGSTPELPGTTGTGSRTELDSEISSAELHTDKILPSELDSKVAPVEMDTEFRFELPTDYNKEKDISEQAMTPLSTCTDATQIPVSPLEEQNLGEQIPDEQKVLVTPGLNFRSKAGPQTHTKP
ncbi:hypothetical protein QBC45DRAFT_317565 [Copromyces sp. CBS 386.78]|nr:hypothetical protein QBC45DRAFT_317565 [Copromyces sp. CBS 386.78]